MKLTREIIFKDVYNIKYILQSSAIICLGIFCVFYENAIVGGIVAIIGYATIAWRISTAKAIEANKFYIMKRRIKEIIDQFLIVGDNEAYGVGGFASQLEPGDEVYFLFAGDTLFAYYPASMELDDDLVELLVKTEL